MDLGTNVLIKGRNSRKIFETMSNKSNGIPSNAERRKQRLEEFAKKIEVQKK